MGDPTTGRRATRIFAVVSTLVLIMATFAAIGVADHADEDFAFERHWDQEDGHGAEHQPEGEECTAWHFVLTPGGERIEDASDLEVEYESGDSDSIEGQRRGQGAWHFTWEKEDADRVDEAHVHFDTESGDEGNHILTLSEADCEIVEPEPQEAEEVDLEPDTSVNPHGSQHTVTATVTDTDGEPFGGAEVLFEVYRDGGDTPVESEVVIADEDGQATFTYTGPDDDADDLIFACTNPDGTAPETCSDDGETLNDDVVGDTAEKQWRDDGPEPDGCPTDLTLTPDDATNTVGDTHEVTATVTDSEGDPCGGIEVLFEVTGANEATGTDTTDDDGHAHFEYTGDEAGTDTITACTTDEGDAPESCDDTDATVQGTATKQWVDGAEAFCRARLVSLFDAEFVLFEANAPGEPCMTEDGSLLNEGQVRLLRAETDEEDNNKAVAEVLGLGGQEGDPGGISLLGARTDCDGQEAYLLLITDSNGEDVLRIAGEDDPLPNLASDEDNGIFFTDTDEDEGKAQVLALRLQGTELVVVSEAETRC